MAADDTFWLVTGRYLPTDAEEDPAGQEQSAEDEVTVQVCETLEKAEQEENWYVDAKITQVVEDPARCEGGSSCLCECIGSETGRHKEWCHYLNQFRPVMA